MSTKSNETLEKINAQISQLQNRKKAIEGKEKLKAKKERTRLLIKYGELAEKYTECKTVEELTEYLEFYKKLGIKPISLKIKIPSDNN